MCKNTDILIAILKLNTKIATLYYGIVPFENNMFAIFKIIDKTRTTIELYIVMNGIEWTKYQVRVDSILC